MVERRPYLRIWRELSGEKSMVMLSGPRQCGKTTLAKRIAEDFTNSLYFNWDVLTDRRMVAEDPYFFQGITRTDASVPLIVLDEIHKYRKWKNYLKGAYDRFHETYRFLVTGSGRLDLHQRGGDSLAGRYYAFRLWPFTLGELHGHGNTLEKFRKDPLRLPRIDLAASQATLLKLSSFSGFPEPHLAAKERSYRRWTDAYHRQLIREDVRDLTAIQSIDDVETLFHLLPSRVGAPLSIPSLATDLRVAYNTVRSWLGVLERFYLTFTLTPWAPQIARAIHKERKTYLFDYARIEDPAARFENLVALELQRAIANWNDMGFGDFGLHYVRTKEGREVDFLVSEGNRPFLLIEAKLTEDTPSPNLRRFQTALGVPAIQLVESGDGFKRFDNNGRALVVAPAAWWLPSLP